MLGCGVVDSEDFFPEGPSLPEAIVQSLPSLLLLRGAPESGCQGRIMVLEDNIRFINIEFCSSPAATGL